MVGLWSRNKFKCPVYHKSIKKIVILYFCWVFLNPSQSSCLFPQRLTCISHKADSGTASYPCQTGDRYRSNTPQTAHDTADSSSEPGGAETNTLPLFYDLS